MVINFNAANPVTLYNSYIAITNSISSHNRVNIIMCTKFTVLQPAQCPSYDYIIFALNALWDHVNCSLNKYRLNLLVLENTIQFLNSHYYFIGLYSNLRMREKHSHYRFTDTCCIAIYYIITLYIVLLYLQLATTRA